MNSKESGVRHSRISAPFSTKLNVIKNSTKSVANPPQNSLLNNTAFDVRLN
jgi:hypothetical protein